MNRSWKGITSLLTGATLLLLIPVANADGVEASERTDSWKMTQGGKIYDNWAKVVYADTSQFDTHPLYPKEGKKSGATTWRCKECHGWDYKGADGAYSKGSHFTGIKGLRDMVGKSTDSIIEAILAPSHGFTEQLIPAAALSELALFISRGQIDMDQYIDRATKKAHGDPQKGAAFYQNICANCHGYDGRLLNFDKAPKKEFVGTVAQANPWETLHKIRNGQPASPMVALGMLSIQDQIDLLAYCQTLAAE
ncbi:c-type cytochrome [Aestuariirhabdus litorea]|uniref:Cytochrome c domain-containing protein n=1 Tax=Aestuariirhabdus litorea TaxID=2528527 RepID=A0A3P3VQX3_9GAMM|nr:c-type cytochrome [Aestuariirhabdus litorea]RRJ85192.1 hypothetical protein D0544_09035 [Aestuariirhabdus litorea]RWW98413.1 hypothetical protein DZC74_09020 [Endozoicomonadaceae bacterium GTF-13]